MGRYFTAMSDISAYFALPDTHRTYSKGMSLYMAHLAANDPKLTAQLLTGPYGTNPSLLDAALLPLKDTATLKYPQLQASVNPVTRDDVTSQAISLKSLQDERRSILQRRARTSQRFHDCKSDAERAEICDAVDQVSAELFEVEGSIEFFRLNGYPPPPPKESKKDGGQLPSDPGELKNERGRLASKRLKLEKRVLELLELPDGDRKRAKVPEVQKRLRECTELLELVKTAIKNLQE